MDDSLLPLIFVALMALAMLVYVVLDGFDLGVGILLPLAGEADKDRMIASIGPFWDANETWLVLGAGLLLVAFPKANGVILGALYLPVTVMLIALILRGVAFDFRVKAHAEHKGIWNTAFFAGSLFAALAQGYMLGSYITGFRQDTLAIWFALLIAVGLASGYALLGATWLILKLEQGLVQTAARWAWRSLWMTGLAIAAVSIVTPFMSPRILEKWFSLPIFFFLLPVPVLTALVFAYCESRLRRILRPAGRPDWRPFAAAVLLFLLAFIGLAYSLFPYLVIDRIRYDEAAAAPASLRFLLVGALITLPAIIGYTVLSYRIFWGRGGELSYE
jgi:cytochrome bd ubiquinol oxidase subunit II